MINLQESKMLLTRMIRSAAKIAVPNTELQIYGDIEDNSKIFFLFLNKNTYCDPSLEPSRRDGSNDGSQYTFERSSMEKNTFIFPFLSEALLLWLFYSYVIDIRLVFIFISNTDISKQPHTVKILKFGTPQTVAIIVLKIEKFDVTLH